MESFLEQISGFKVDSKFNLKFELFSSYEKFVKEDKFISFLDWCNVILNDFSDIDAYLLEQESNGNFLGFSNVEILPSTFLT